MSEQLPPTATQLAEVIFEVGLLPRGAVVPIEFLDVAYRYWKAVHKAAAPLQQEADNDCHWSQDSDGCWNSACGQCFEFNEGSPRENNANFCHFCGGKMVEHGFTEEPFDDEDAALPSDENAALK